jgi:cysteinyl-tRNA synthetase
MSKSTGNIVSLRDVLDTYGREAILVFFLSGHYRGPLDYSESAMTAAQSQVDAFRNAARTPGLDSGDDDAEWSRFADALEDDFNTPKALALMHEWRAGMATRLLGRALTLFALGSLTEPEIAPPEVRRLALERKEARTHKDFATSDRLRDEIAALGWEVRDTDDDFDLVPL